MPSEADGVVAVRVDIESSTPIVSALLADVPRLTARGKREAAITLPVVDNADDRCRCLNSFERCRLHPIARKQSSLFKYRAEDIADFEMGARSGKVHTSLAFESA